MRLPRWSWPSAPTPPAWWWHGTPDHHSHGRDHARAFAPLITPPPPPPSLPAFNPISPIRVVDTRDASTPIDGGQVLEIDVVARGGVPEDATAVVLDVAVTAGQEAGYLTVYPCAGAQPPTSNLNYVADQTVANSVTSAIGTNGTVCIYVQSRAPCHCRRHQRLLESRLGLPVPPDGACSFDRHT